ncbi:MAG TPA: hypothetical protein VEA44_09820 [Caulobacter sp.]|nr:hypothetical protein [Caulobacter sp.]
MRWMAVLAAAVLSTGCMGDLAKGPETLTQAVAAYRAGDVSGLRTLADEADASAKAELAAKGGDDPCTDQGMKAVKAVAVAYFIRLLDNPMVTSMSPEARYMYLSRLGQGGVVAARDIPPTIRTCKEERNGLRAFRDVLTMLSVVQVVMKETDTWNIDLQEQYGTEYAARMEAAELTLRRNGAFGRDEAPRWATRHTP